MTAEKKAIIEYRLERAHATLDEARVLVENKSWAGCLNRTYYACFYAVNALLLAHGLSSAKHSGVRSLFNRDFVNTGIVPRECGALYNHLSANRMDSDYEDLIVVD
ncbi:MAG: HEPN domain-containing protein [Candidatus Hydrogenedentes bacterium]|nr:HEPN domain-containing protein [Candidatus Hydrogenedentota bacterium]